MNLRKLFFAIIAVLAMLFFTISGNFRSYEIISVGMAVYVLINFIDAVGKSYNVLDLPVLLAIFQCLIMPMIVYHVYNNDYIVMALQYDMGTPAETYFSFVLPAIVAMTIGFKIPLGIHNDSNKNIAAALERSKEYLKGKGNLGVLLSIMGLVSGFLQIFVPGELSYIAYLFGKLLYVGILYTFCSDAKNRKVFLIGGLLAMLLQSLTQGMFGELIFTMALAIMLLSLGSKMKSGVKFSVVTAGLVLVLLIQSIKGEYRNITWYGGGDQSKGQLGTFISLITDRLTKPEKFFDMYEMFPTVNRFNQGMIISKVFQHVPSNEPFAGGETIFKTIAASFVPRILWPDKPKSGGHYNVERFAGFKIEGYSMNISPLGEAYANFGITGGIIFMFCYGLFFNVALLLLVLRVKKNPTLILWFPILFLNSIQIETDILMCVNSLIKNLIFIGFCYWAADRFLRLKL